ncbi:hypothetical protein LSAT2_029518 [Lamellibrachia satsuma]|nr:hypothetical protein LSAT2_029518 [Lamellibrachia satsuma]
MRVHVKLLLLAALLSVTVGLGPDDPYILCIRLCATELNTCETNFKRRADKISECRFIYFRCMTQCLREHCPVNW